MSNGAERARRLMAAAERLGTAAPAPRDLDMWAYLDVRRRDIAEHILWENRSALLAAFDALRPRLIRLQALTAKCSDTRVALGSDILAASYDGYDLLKMFGKADNVAPLQETMRANVRRKSPAPAKDTA